MTSSEKEAVRAHATADVKPAAWHDLGLATFTKEEK